VRLLAASILKPPPPPAPRLVYSTVVPDYTFLYHLILLVCLRPACALFTSRSRAVWVHHRHEHLSLHGPVRCGAAQF
jgi:hypothetical protein